MFTPNLAVLTGAPGVLTHNLAVLTYILAVPTHITIVGIMVASALSIPPLSPSTGELQCEELTSAHGVALRYLRIIPFTLLLTGSGTHMT